MRQTGLSRVPPLSLFTAKVYKLSGEVYFKFYAAAFQWTARNIFRFPSCPGKKIFARYIIQPPPRGEREAQHNPRRRLRFVPYPVKTEQAAFAAGTHAPPAVKSVAYRVGKAEAEHYLVKGPADAGDRYAGTALGKR